MKKEYEKRTTMPARYREIAPILSEAEMKELLKRVGQTRCCSCNEQFVSPPEPLPLKRVHMIMMDYKATWDNPVWKTGIGTYEDPTPRAMAILCEKCVNEAKKPTQAIEFRGNEIVYHDVKELEDAPMITPEIIMRYIGSLASEMETDYLDREARRRNMGIIPFHGPN